MVQRSIRLYSRLPLRLDRTVFQMQTPSWSPLVYRRVRVTFVEALSKYQVARSSCPERVCRGFFQQLWHACRIFSLTLARLFRICGKEAWFGFCYQLGHFQLRCQPTLLVG